MHARCAVEPERRLVHDPPLHPRPAERGQLRLGAGELSPGGHDRCSVSPRMGQPLGALVRVTHQRERCRRGSSPSRGAGSCSSGHSRCPKNPRRCSRTSIQRSTRPWWASHTRFPAADPALKTCAGGVPGGASGLAADRQIDRPGAWVRRVVVNLSVSAVRRRVAEAKALARVAAFGDEPWSRTSRPAIPSSGRPFGPSPAGRRRSSPSSTWRTERCRRGRGSSTCRRAP